MQKHLAGLAAHVLTLTLTSAAPAISVELSVQKKAWYNATDPQSVSRLTLVRLSGGGDGGTPGEVVAAGAAEPRSTAESAPNARRLGGSSDALRAAMLSPETLSCPPAGERANS